MTDLYPLIAVIWAVSAILAAVIGSVRGRDVTDSFLIGLFLGPLGVLMAAMPVRKE